MKEQVSTQSMVLSFHSHKVLHKKQKSAGSAMTKKSKYILYIPERTAGFLANSLKESLINSPQSSQPYPYKPYKMQNSFCTVRSCSFLSSAKGPVSPFSSQSSSILSKQERRKSQKWKSAHLWSPGILFKANVRRRWTKCESPVNMAKQLGRSKDSFASTVKIDKATCNCEVNKEPLALLGRKEKPHKNILELIPRNYHPNNVREDLNNRKQEALKIFHKTRVTTAPFLGFLKVQNFSP